MSAVSLVRYPLEAAVVLRNEDEERAKRALAAAIEAHALAVSARERAEAALLDHGAETARVARDERARDEAGRSASDALTAQAWLARRKTEAGALVSARDARQKDERDRAAAIEGARAALAMARAEVEALIKHRAGWDAEQQKTRERREEAELEDRSAHRGRS